MLPPMRMAAGKSVFAPRVLTVDNYQPALETLSDELRWSGYVVKNVHTAREAILAAQSFLPDLLVTDVLLPSMDGIAAAVHVKEWDPQCQVLLFGDSGVASRGMRLIAAGGFSFQLYPKPKHPAELLQHVDRIFGTQVYSRQAS